MSTDSTKTKLLVHALCAAISALLFGFCLAGMIRHFDSLYLTVMALFGFCLVADLWWTRRDVRRLAVDKSADRAATQFLWSCVFFSLLSCGLGIAVSKLNGSSADPMSTFNLIFWGAMTGIAIYPVWRDAKSFANAAGASGL